MTAMRTFTTAAAILLAVAGSPSHAADASCAPVARAAAAAQAQARIHAAIDAPLDPEALKAGFKPVLMHSIVIDQVQYSNAIRASFSKTPLESKEMRLLAADLGPFLVEQGCKAAGSERVDGREALVFLASGDLGRGEIRFKLWIDKASGLPLRAVADEPDADDDVEAVLRKLDRKRAAAPAPAPKAAVRRVVSTHAYVFGEAVKPPGAAGPDAQALALLQRLLRGTP